MSAGWRSKFIHDKEQKSKKKYVVPRKKKVEYPWSEDKMYN